MKQDYGNKPTLSKSTRSWRSRTIAVIAIATIVLAVSLAMGVTGYLRDKQSSDLGKENLNLAWDAYDRGDIETALEHAIAADFHYEGLPTSAESADTHNMIILLYYMAGLEEKALERIKHFNHQELPLIDPGSRANFYLLSAYLFATVDHNKDTALAYTDSLKNHHAIANPDDSAMNYLDMNNIVEIYLAIGDTANSWQLIDYMDRNPVEPVARYSHQLNINKARLFDMAQGNDSAVKYARQILDENKNERIDAHNRTIAYSILMRADSVKGNLQLYALHRDSLDHLRYEIQGNNKKYMIAAIEGRNRAEALLKDIKLQKAQNVLWIVTVCFAALLAVSLVFLKLRDRKAKHRIAVLECQRLAAEVRNSQLQCERLAGEVRTRDDELTLHINEKEKLTRQLCKAMNNVAAISPVEHLRLRLNQEQPAFMELLNRKFPEISANDKLILGAVKAGLSPKDTAAALSISHSSLLTARYRLRKKLALTSDTDLDVFVANLKGE